MLIRPLEEAIEKLDDLPRARQQLAAEILEMVIGGSDEVYELSDDELGLIDLGLAQLDRGEVATESRVRAVFDKYK